MVVQYKDSLHYSLGIVALSDSSHVDISVRVRIPVLELELARGTLGGVVITVEGLITKKTVKVCFFTFAFHFGSFIY